MIKVYFRIRRVHEHCLGRGRGGECEDKESQQGWKNPSQGRQHHSHPAGLHYSTTLLLKRNHLK